jgi:hypothetical protein
MKRQFIIVTLVIFIVLSVVFYVLSIYAPQYHTTALEAGNLIMALLTFSSYLIMKKQMAISPAAFVRGVSGTSFLRLMVCMISILVYVLLNRTHIHKASVFVLFGIYAIYTTAETLLVSKLARDNK